MVLVACGGEHWLRLLPRLSDITRGLLPYVAKSDQGRLLVGYTSANYQLQYNLLSELLTEPPKHPLVWWLLRLAFIGFCASIVSDSISNSLRVIKTYRQVNDTKVSYSEHSLDTRGDSVITNHNPFLAEAARAVVRQDGVIGLFGRGLKTRILCNGLQGLLFSILWKLFLDL
jgi:hypothetical protein